jgi:hypothetical protein
VYNLEQHGPNKALMDKPSSIKGKEKEVEYKAIRIDDLERFPFTNPKEQMVRDFLQGITKNIKSIKTKQDDVEMTKNNRRKVY